MYTLVNTFTSPEVTISRHRTLAAAVKAQALHSKAVRHANGQSSYIPTTIRDSESQPVHPNALLEAEADHHTYGAWRPRR